MKKIAMITTACLFLGACANEANVVSNNIKNDADNFKINRRIIYMDLWTGAVLLLIEGNCSQEPLGDRLKITCKTPEGQFKQHILAIGPNVTYFSEQLDAVKEGTARYKITFKPSILVPDFQLQ